MIRGDKASSVEIRWNEWERGSRHKQNLIVAYTRGLLRIAICQEVGGQIRRAVSNRVYSRLPIPGYADFPKITLKRRLQFPPWISNIEDGSCRLSSLHWILAHRYSISIRRSLDGRDTSCFLLPCNSIYYFFPQVWFIEREWESLSFSSTKLWRIVFFDKKVSDFWNFARVFRPTTRLIWYA